MLLEDRWHGDRLVEPQPCGPGRVGAFVVVAGVVGVVGGFVDIREVDPSWATSPTEAGGGVGPVTDGHLLGQEAPIGRDVPGVCGFHPHAEGRNVPAQD